MNGALLESMVDFQKSMQTESLRAWRRWVNIPKVPEIARDVQIANTPHDVVYEEDSLKLLRYRSAALDRFHEPMLVCFALVNRPYILDLQPARSVVRQLLKARASTCTSSTGASPPRPIARFDFRITCAGSCAMSPKFVVDTPIRRS